VGNSSLCSAPLYLQYNGHSITIVGYEKNYGSNECNLLVFDPACRGINIQKSLRNDNNLWMKEIKFPLNAFQEECYQILYIDSGLAKEMTVKERNDSKIITATQHFT
jgi:hypothetical protein